MANDLRERFEKACKGNFLITEVNEAGYYSNSRTNDAWWGYQAASNQTQELVDALQKRSEQWRARPITLFDNRIVADELEYFVAKFNSASTDRGEDA